MHFKLKTEIKEGLRAGGVERFLMPGGVDISKKAAFEPPCSIKWITIENAPSVAAFLEPEWAVEKLLAMSSVADSCTPMVIATPNQPSRDL